MSIATVPHAGAPLTFGGCLHPVWSETHPFNIDGAHQLGAYAVANILADLDGLRPTSQEFEMSPPCSVTVGMLSDCAVMRE